MESKQQYLHAHFYDLLDSSRVDSTDASVRFFLHYALRAGDALELGAGAGRIALAIAGQHIPVWAVEPSPMMRAACLVKAAQQPHLYPFFTLLPGSAQDVRINRSFRFIYASGVSMHWTSEDQWHTVLENIARHLADDGIFVVDNLCLTPPEHNDSPLAQVSQSRLGEIEYRTYFGRTWIDERRYRFHTRYEVIYQDVVIEAYEDDSIGSFLCQETCYGLLKEVGLQVRAAYQNFSFTPVSETAEHVILEAGWS